MGNSSKPFLGNVTSTNPLPVDIRADSAGIGSTQYAEDAAHNSGDTGTLALVVRRDWLTSSSGTDGDYSTLNVNKNGALYVVEKPPDGKYDVFGHQVTGSLGNNVDVQFFRDTPANLVTVATAGGGTAASNAGGALFSSSTGTSGASKGTSNTNVEYRSGAEVYALITAAWLDGGQATSFQRIGLYDDNNGFFIGFENTTFGITVRNNAVDTTVALASFSEDPLDGSAGSAFTRAGTPEALDTSLLNVFRIRFGWLGSAPIYWEVLAPDGHWVTFHKSLFPNSQNTPHIRNVDLPVQLHILKTAGATNIRMQTDCWGAGVTTNQGRLDDTVTDATLVQAIRSVLTAKKPNGDYVNIGSTAGGNLKVSLQEASDGLDIGAGNAGTETLRVSVSTDDVNLSAINKSTAGTATGFLYKTIELTASGEAALVTAVAGTRMRCVAAFLVGEAASKIKFTTSGAGTNLTGEMAFAANGGISLPYNPAGWFQTVTGQGIFIQQATGSANVGGAITYVQV